MHSDGSVWLTPHGEHTQTTWEPFPDEPDEPPLAPVYVVVSYNVVEPLLPPPLPPTTAVPPSTVIILQSTISSIFCIQVVLLDLEKRLDVKPGLKGNFIIDPVNSENVFNPSW
ncbi:hypothetical protein [Tenacibaculum sp.]|uniref:hypothetical protein n=1 Tax=Tenacibaculum sp. TaxID=1906242 RepID=UPI003AA85384